jgi:hypothetical protein
MDLFLLINFIYTLINQEPKNLFEFYSLYLYNWFIRFKLSTIIYLHLYIVVINELL